MLNKQSKFEEKVVNIRMIAECVQWLGNLAQIIQSNRFIG
jgi:hypothetical protein